LNVARLGLVAALVAALALAALVFGPWVKMRLLGGPDVEMSLTSTAKEEAVLFVTYKAHNKGSGGPVELVCTIEYSSMSATKRTLIVSFEAGGTLERTEQFLAVPRYLPGSAFDVVLEAKPRWIPFRW